MGTRLSTETVILLELRAIREELVRTNRRLDVLGTRVTARADRLRTCEAAALAGVDRRTLLRWAEQGRLTHHDGPRPWSRDELDACLEGRPPAVVETRGRRRRVPIEPAASAGGVS